MLASTLLAGCKGISASSPTASASSGTSPISSSSTTTTTTVTTQTPTNKTADVSWAAPTTNTNGSALTDLAGYVIYYGTSPGSLTETVDVQNAGATDYVVQSLTTGTWYFAVAAYTNSGLQSTLSTVVSKTIT